MAQVTVTINGRGYAVACKEGEEQRVLDLAALVDGKVKGFAREFGAAGEARLLAMAALVLADELLETREAARRVAPGNGAAAEDGRIAVGIDRLAQRLEAIAGKLEASHI